MIRVSVRISGQADSRFSCDALVGVKYLFIRGPVGVLFTIFKNVGPKKVLAVAGQLRFAKRTEKRMSGGFLTVVAPQMGDPSFGEVHTEVLSAVVVSRSCTGVVAPRG